MHYINEISDIVYVMKEYGIILLYIILLYMFCMKLYDVMLLFCIIFYQ